MLIRFYCVLSCCIAFIANSAEASSNKDLRPDFLNDFSPELSVIKESKKKVSFPGSTKALFIELKEHIEFLRTAKSDHFPYDNEELTRRFQALKQNLISEPAQTETDMIDRLSYFALIHYAQIKASAPSLASRLTRVEEKVAFSVFPSKKEVLWLFPETYLSGLPRTAFIEFLDLLFQRFDSVKEKMGIKSLRDEKNLIEKQRDKSVNSKDLTEAGWPAHNPRRIMVGWFCLLDRLIGTDKEAEKFEEISRTINLHKTALSQMDSQHKEKLPPFMCSSCLETALYMNGISNEETSDDTH